MDMLVGWGMRALRNRMGVEQSLRGNRSSRARHEAGAIPTEQPITPTIMSMYLMEDGPLGTHDEKIIELTKERNELMTLLKSEKITRNHIVERSVKLERELGQCNDRHAKSIITWGKELAKTQEERDELMPLLRSEKIKRNHIVERNMQLERELAEARNQRDRLAEAADDLVKRWETPHWKNAPDTAEYIYRLRDLVAAVKGGANKYQKEPIVSFVVIAFRYGGLENTFPIGAFTTLAAAEKAAAEHRAYRGGKYEHRIYQFEPDEWDDDIGHATNRLPCINHNPSAASS